MFTVSEQIEYDPDGIKIVDGYRVDKDGRPVAFDLASLDARILCEGCAVHQDLGKTPAELAARLADAQAEIARLRGALEKYEAVREDMFGHFCSNGLFNAWGKEFDCSGLNDAHLMAEAALKK